MLSQDEILKTLFNKIKECKSIHKVHGYVEMVETILYASVPKKFYIQCSSPHPMKIEAIKAVRAFMGIGLKEAKDLVEGDGYLGEFLPEKLKQVQQHFNSSNYEVVMR